VRYGTSLFINFSAFKRRLKLIEGHISTSSEEASLRREATTSQLVVPNGPTLLSNERRKATFQSREMTYLLDGGKHETAVKEKIAKLIENDEILRVSELNREDEILLRIGFQYMIYRERSLERGNCIFSDSFCRTMAKIKRTVELRSELQDPIAEVK
jgi:hypothetical protein